MSVLQLVENQTSADNNIRTSAELEFNELTRQSPTSVASELIQLAGHHDFPVDIRQACLLHLKRLVPKYWSMAFQSFTGPPIDQSVKAMIRHNLIQLATSSPVSKLRSGSAYAIVQIASADYPDEWPDLLNSLYQSTNNFQDEISMIGGLTVLNDLFDDLVTEEQFWDGGIGVEITNHIMQLLSKDLHPDIKTSAIKLYQNVLNNLQSPEAFTEERKAGVNQHIATSIEVFTDILEKSVNLSANSSPNQNEFYYRSYVYGVITTLIGSFGKRISPDLKKKVLDISLQDFNRLSELFHNSNEAETPVFTHSTNGQSNHLDVDPSTILNSLIVQLLQTILIIQNQNQHYIYNSVPIDLFVENLNRICITPNSTIEEYEADINTFVSDISGLSISLNIRDTINEVISELGNPDAKLIFQSVLKSLTNSGPNWKLQESNLYILECLFTNEDTKLLDDSQISLTDLLKVIAEFISYEHSLITSRCFLLLPKFFEKFEDHLSVKTFGLKTFIGMIDFTVQNQSSAIIRMSTLISLILYKNLIDFAQVLDDQSLRSEIQYKIFQIVYSLIEDSEDDGLTSLLEAITVSVDLDPLSASKLRIDSSVSVIDLIFKISFKDASNVQLTIDSSESLSSLLSQISIEDYLICCEKSLPFIVNILVAEIEKGAVEYTPELYLSLELLSIIIDSFPGSSNEEESAGIVFPPQIFNYIFPTIKSLLVSTTDNQILQSGGEVFNSLLKKASQNFLTFVSSETNESGMTSLLSIVSKFLSPDLSDSAAMNSGLIVLSLLERFQSYLDSNFLSQLLEATVKRLVLAKESVTIENLIMVFCKLVLNSPKEMIDLLESQISVENPASNSNVDGLSAVLPIWFESFEVTRGYEKIKQNVLALGKIFTLNDKRVQSMIVNGEIIPYQGDLIITRSMAKSMPDQYTQIPASLKILKLLIGELEFQCQQPDANDYLPLQDGENAEAGDDDDEGWEDMNDIGVPNYDKLKSYVDSDNEEDDHEDHSGDDSLLKILVQFFKECTAKNLGNFQYYYEQLGDDEKKAITENLVFE